MKRDLEIFEQAIALPSREAREAFLLGACGSNRDLRPAVDELLAAFDAAGEIDFLGERSVEAQTVLQGDHLYEGPGAVIGRYKLLQKIGEGGMGVVYMAEQEEPVRRRVALKIIKLGMDTRQVVARFEAERQALALMDHPNIARVLDGGATETGRPYFVMELVQGVPITEYCNKKRLPARERLRLCVQVCHAIQTAHQKGIIHRDIKPSNVLVTFHHGEPMPKVIDFGIAKATNQKLTEKTLVTQFGTMIGTPAYMSPEQAEMSSTDVDTRTDVYALGVLLYELLTGTTPFPAQRLHSLGYAEMQRVIANEEPDRPSTRLSTMANEQKMAVAENRAEDLVSLSKLLKGDLDWVVMRCLEKDRTRRYDTAHDLAMDLTRHLNNEPVVARPRTVAYRFQKALRRNKLAFAAGGFVLLALLIGASVSFWQALVANSARRVAQYEAYVAKINLAQAVWEQNQVSRMHGLLNETKTSPERGFEWLYWKRQMHLELLALRSHAAPILSVAYSANGQRIATASADHTARLWDSETGKELMRLDGHDALVSSVAFSANGQRIISGSWDKTARVWDALGGRVLLKLEGHEGGIFSVAFSPDGLRAVTGGQDNTARVWDGRTGKELLQFTNHTHPVLTVAFSPDGRRIVSGGWDRTAKVWDAATGEELFALIGHSGAVWSAAFSPDGQRMLTGSQDSRAKIWDAVSGTNLFTLKGHRGTVFSAGFSRDGTRIVTSGDDQTARVWNVANGEEIQILKGHGSRIGSAAFSPDGQRIVTGGGAILSEPTGRFFGSVAEDPVAKVWNIADVGKGSTLEGHTNAVSSVEFSPDGRMVASGSFDGTARLWDVQTRRELQRFGGGGVPIRSIAFFPDGQRLVTGSFDGTAKVWEIATGKVLLDLMGHAAEVFSVAVSPGGRWIATGSWDGTVKLWNVTTGANLRTLQNDGGTVYSVVFSPDGQQIISASAARDEGPGRITAWSVGDGRALFTFQNSG